MTVLIPCCHLLLLLVSCLTLPTTADTRDSGACTVTADIAVFGGTVCGVTATVGAHRSSSADATVAWIVSGQRLGGMTSGGLGGLDAGMPFGGIAKELIGPLGANFEPHVAEAAVEALLASATNDSSSSSSSGSGSTSPRTALHRHAGDLLSVATDGAAPRRIVSATFSSGLVVCAKTWVDCSYEGDLLRLSGTRFALGREAAADFNESMAGRDDGAAAAPAATPSFFAPGVSPWVDDGRNSTLLPSIVEVLGDGLAGSGDSWVQSYCFRLCLTNNASNRVPIAPPADYDRAELELLRRELDWATHAGNMTLAMSDLFLLRHLPHQKLDLNSGQFSEATVSPVSRRHGGYFPFSTDAPGLQHDWPLGNATARAAVFAAHERQHRALLHFLGTDAQLRSWQPALVAEVGSFGLAADEFTESGHWPPQLYVRESIRMRGARVLTQADVLSPTGAPTPREPRSVGTSKWGIDVHAVKRVAVKPQPPGEDGSGGGGGWRVANAGGRDTARDRGAWGTTRLIEVPYEALVPAPDDTDNLLVPVCISATHVAQSTYRLEPQYAVFGHSAGAAAALAVGRDGAGNGSVHGVDVRGELQPLLASQGQILHGSPAPGPSPPPPPPYAPLALGNCTGGGGGGGGAAAKPSKWSYSAALRTVTTAGGRCASVLGYSSAAGAQAVAAACHTADKAPSHQNQEFEAINAGAQGVGGVQLRNVHSGLCLGRGSSAAAAEVAQVPCAQSGTVWQLATDAAAAAVWELLDGRGTCVY